MNGDTPGLGQDCELAWLDNAPHNHDLCDGRNIYMTPCVCPCHRQAPEVDPVEPSGFDAGGVLDSWVPVTDEMLDTMRPRPVLSPQQIEAFEYWLRVLEERDLE